MTLKYPITMDYVDGLSGRQFEVFTKELLNTLGYKTAHVTPATHDHGLDVLYMNNQNQLVGVQDKHYGAGTKIGYDAIKDTDAGTDYYNTDIGIVLTNCYFGKNALKSAHTGKLNIKCWDRDVLKELIDIGNNILFNRIKNSKNKNRFTYKITSKSKKQYLFIKDLSYSEWLLINTIVNNLKKYKHRKIFFTFKEFPKLVSNLKLPKRRTNRFQLQAKIHLLFNNIQYKCLTQNGPFYPFSNIDVDDDKKTVVLKISDIFYFIIYSYLPNN